MSLIMRLILRIWLSVHSLLAIPVSLSKPLHVGQQGEEGNQPGGPAGRQHLLSVMYCSELP